MLKVILIIGIVLITLSLALFISDLLPVDLFQSQNKNTYMKVVPAESGSFSWFQYRLHFLVLGLVLIGLAKYMGKVG